MNELAEKFYDWASEHGWNIEYFDEKRELPEAVSERYKYIPNDWTEFIQCFKNCSDSENNIWFSLLGDFENGANGFLERLSLNLAENNEELKNELREFWDNHIPIAFCDEYHYYAIGIKTGEVFKGWEPEFEDVEICATSFADFIEKIVSGKIVLI